MRDPMMLDERASLSTPACPAPTSPPNNRTVMRDTCAAASDPTTSAGGSILWALVSRLMALAPCTNYSRAANQGLAAGNQPDPRHHSHPAAQVHGGLKLQGNPRTPPTPG